jgi:hypothetical protein
MAVWTCFETGQFFHRILMICCISFCSTIIIFASFCHPHRCSQRVQWKKKLGLRDESIYRDGAAGDGANQNHKRQG